MAVHPCRSAPPSAPCRPHRKGRQSPGASSGKVDPVFHVQRCALRRGASEWIQKWHPLFGPMLEKFDGRASRGENQPGWRVNVAGYAPATSKDYPKACDAPMTKRRKLPQSSSPSAEVVANLNRREAALLFAIAERVSSPASRRRGRGIHDQALRSGFPSPPLHPETTPSHVITGLVPVIPIRRSEALFQSEWPAQGRP